MTDIEILQTVRKEWTKNKYCAHYFVENSPDNRYGDDIQSLHAVRWCAQGYIAKVMGFHSGELLWDTPLYKDILKPLSCEMYGLGLAAVNNDFGHAAVVKVLDAALEKLQVR